MELLNADGSYSEVSGNGVRCLAAWMASASSRTSAEIEIATDAGVKRLTCSSGAARATRSERSWASRRTSVECHSTPVASASTRSRCGSATRSASCWAKSTEARLHTVAGRWRSTRIFLEGTNVELAEVQAPDRVRILIWERGVGPTEASGTGACAAAVAAHRYGGASNDVRVSSPGGTQRVEWLDDGLYLTGWAEVVAEATWIDRSPPEGR